MKFINKIRENYYYNRARYCMEQANKNLDNRYICFWWMCSFSEHWEKYTNLLNKRLGVF